MARYAILAHAALSPAGAKTANALVKYAHDGWNEDSVACIIDRTKAGQDAGDFLGAHGRGIPIVASAKDALAHRPDTLAIGIAPVGGALPDDWRADLRDALSSGLDILSGLHIFLGDDPELAAIARARGRRIVDVRRPPATRRIATGDGALVPAVVVTFVGTDCSSGKMTAAVELTREAQKRGIDAGFIATGQTGIMIGCDAGSPLDAVTSDFVAGEMERCVLDVAGKGRQLIFVEGQGALTHPAYGGVTASLVAGSFPDLLVLCAEPRRTHFRFPSAYAFRLNGLARERDLNEALVAATTGARVAATAIMTSGLTDAEYREETRKAEAAVGVPAGDVFRSDAPRLLDAVLLAATTRGLWRDGRYAGAKGDRARAGRIPEDA